MGLPDVANRLPTRTTCRLFGLLGPMALAWPIQWKGGYGYPAVDHATAWPVLLAVMSPQDFKCFKPDIVSPAEVLRREHVPMPPGLLLTSREAPSSAALPCKNLLTYAAETGLYGVDRKTLQMLAEDSAF